MITNELVGYDVDLAKEVAKRLNVKISFKEYNVDGQITSFQKENQILLRTILVSQKKEKILPFRAFQIFIWQYDRTKKDDSGIHSLDDLKGKAAGEPNTSYMRLAEKHGAKLVTYDNANEWSIFKRCSKRSPMTLF